MSRSGPPVSLPRPATSWWTSPPRWATTHSGASRRSLRSSRCSRWWTSRVLRRRSVVQRARSTRSSPWAELESELGCACRRPRASRARDPVRSQQRSLEALLELTARYAESADVDALLHDVTRRLAEMLDIPRASLLLDDGAGSAAGGRGERRAPTSRIRESRWTATPRSASAAHRPAHGRGGRPEPSAPRGNARARRGRRRAFHRRAPPERSGEGAGCAPGPRLGCSVQPSPPPRWTSSRRWPTPPRSRCGTRVSWRACAANPSGEVRPPRRRAESGGAPALPGLLRPRLRGHRHPRRDGNGAAPEPRRRRDARRGIPGSSRAATWRTSPERSEPRRSPPSSARWPGARCSATSMCGRTPSNRQLTLSVSGAPLREGNAAAILSFRDVTEPRRIENELPPDQGVPREAGGQHRGRGGGHGHAGHFILFNKGAEALTGYTAQDAFASLSAADFFVGEGVGPELLERMRLSEHGGPGGSRSPGRRLSPSPGSAFR